MALPDCARACRAPCRAPQLGFVTEIPPRGHRCRPLRARGACEAPGPVLPGRGAGDNGEHFKSRLLKKHSRALVQWAIFHQACKEWLADGLKIQLNTFTDLSINIIF